MTTLLDLYLAQLRQYNSLKSKLYNILETVVKMKPVTQFGYNFVPHKTSISEEIKQWPESAPPLPPSGWVEPRKGVIEINGDIWEFAFHGAGLSFFHSQTHQDVSIEYTKTGELGITQWTMQVYLETLPSNVSYIHDLLAQHTNLFEQVISLGYLTKVPPLFGEGSDDQTFVVTPIIDRLAK
jgi:hypothetical protein